MFLGIWHFENGQITRLGLNASHAVKKKTKEEMTEGLTTILYFSLIAEMDGSR